MVQGRITLFHSAAAVFAGFYGCACMPVGFVVGVVGCCLKVVPGCLFGRHSGGRLELHPGMFVID